VLDGARGVDMGAIPDAAALGLAPPGPPLELVG